MINDFAGALGSGDGATIGSFVDGQFEARNAICLAFTEGLWSRDRSLRAAALLE
jgi:hypothetical protein